jgi:hypothetical protein
MLIKSKLWFLHFDYTKVRECKYGFVVVPWYLYIILELLTWRFSGLVTVFYYVKWNSADLTLLMILTEKQSDGNICILWQNRVVIFHHSVIPLYLNNKFSAFLFPIFARLVYKLYLLNVLFVIKLIFHKTKINCTWKLLEEKIYREKLITRKSEFPRKDSQVFVL